MTDNTPRLGLPYLIASQAQKEVTHNEALNTIEALLQPAVQSIILTAPPAGVEGNLYIVGAGATGAWVGKDGKLAQFIGGAWTFYSVFEGMQVYNIATSQQMIYVAGTWKDALATQNKIGFFGAVPATKTKVTLMSADGAISGLTISAIYSQVEVQALRDAAETLADDVRTLKAALSTYGLV